MGFLKNLFASTKEKEKTIEIYKLPIRAQHKDYNFFKKELDFNTKAYQIISDDNDIILEKEGKLFPRNYDTLYGLLEKRSSLCYAIGENPSDILNVFEDAYDNFILSLDENFDVYDDLLKVISKAILFDISDKKINVLGNFIKTMGTNENIEIWRPDKIIGYLLNSKDKNFEIPNDILFSNLYIQFEKIIDASNKKNAEKEVQKYLDEWYGLHKNDPWYDTHKKQRGYSGYWSWEAGAVVKVMGLDDSSFKDHPHYPYDMVHWKDNETV